jgi:DNA polymerase-3 subunit delta
MFREKKLLILKNLFSNLKAENDFLKNLKEISKSEEIILIYEEEIDEKSPLAEKLKKEAKFQKFELLEGIFLKNWVKREFQKYSAKIESIALNLLLDFVGNDLWQMENEIKKLVTYKTGHNQVTTVTKICQIGVRDVELLVKPKIEADIFKTIDAIAAKNKKRALFLMKEHLEKGDPPAYLLAMINFQFRNLLMAKSYLEGSKFYPNYANMRILSQKLKMHPYVIRKAIQQSRKFSLDELKKIYQKIFQVDLGVKTGKMEPETALDLLIAEI